MGVPIVSSCLKFKPIHKNGGACRSHGMGTRMIKTQGGYNITCLSFTTTDDIKCAVIDGSTPIHA